MRLPANRPKAVRQLVAIAVGVAISLSGPDLAAQQTAAADSLVGTVVLNGESAAGIPVTLHRVTPESSGAVAQSTSDAAGEFRFPLPPAENASFNVFFVTADYLSIQYFGHPLNLEQPNEGYTVAIYDTTSAPAQPARVNRRDVVMLPQQNDSWEVTEIISVLNPGGEAIVGQSGMPSMEIALPEGAADFQAGEGDVRPNEFTFMENRILVTAPVLPGRRDIFLRYRLPARPPESVFSFEQATDTFNIYVQQPSHLTAVEGIGTTQMIDVEGEQYLQYGAIGLSTESVVALEWRGGTPIDPIVAAVAVTVALLAAGAFVAMRNRQPVAPA